MIKTKNNNKVVGNIGERIAKFYLCIKGYKILKCNYSCKYGELDIIAEKSNKIHFVEVKTRTSKFIEGREAVNYAKLKHIINTATYYLIQSHNTGKEISFDVAEIYLLPNKLELNYIENIKEK